MKITKSMNGSTFVVAVAGRLDTMTASELDKVLNEGIPNADELELDFGDLEYISSAGLRVVLGAYKVMGRKGGMRITHASDTVRDVFDVTGLASVLMDD